VAAQVVEGAALVGVDDGGARLVDELVAGSMALLPQRRSSPKPVRPKGISSHTERRRQELTLSKRASSRRLAGGSFR
jgi:hypothetical protein